MMSLCCAKYLFHTVSSYSYFNPWTWKMGTWELWNFWTWVLILRTPVQCRQPRQGPCLLEKGSINSVFTISLKSRKGVLLGILITEIRNKGGFLSLLKGICLSVDLQKYKRALSLKIMQISFFKLLGNVKGRRGYRPSLKLWTNKGMNHVTSAIGYILRNMTSWPIWQHFYSILHIKYIVKCV